MIASFATLVVTVGIGAALAPAPPRAGSLVPATGPQARPAVRRVRRRGRPTVIGAVLAAAAIALLGPVPTATLFIGGWSIVRWRRAVRARRVHRAVHDAVADGLELLVLVLHAGITPAAAARELARHAPPPLRPGWEAVVLRLDRGRSLADAVTVLVDHHGAAVAPVVQGLVAAERYGTPLAPALERWSDEIRSARRRTAEAHARTLSVRMSFPLVCCTLPSFVLLAVVPTLAGTISTLRGIG